MSADKLFAMTSRRDLLKAMCCAPLALKAQQTQPNIVVFLVDDMGYGDIGAYGVTDTKTPNLDRLAKEGVKLTNFYSNGPVCTPTRAALMTGRYQQRVGLEWAIGPGMKGKGLPSSEVTLPRLLKSAGYATGMFGKWHLGYEPEFGPNAHGFDEFFGILSGNVDHYSHREVNGERDLYEGTMPAVQQGFMTDLITERAVKYVNTHAKESFFLYGAFNTVHWPFQPPERPDTVRDRASWTTGSREIYVQMMESMDSAVGQVLDALDKNGLASNTLVIFTDDNGGERFSRNIPLRHHKGTLWEGGIRVPCLIRWPERLPSSKTIDQPAITMDLTATILGATGVRPAPGRDLDGMDLLPVLRGEAPPRERTFFWRIDRADRKQKAARNGKWKYVRDGPIEQLFDLDSDISESQDLAFDNTAVVAQLRDAVDAWESELAKTPPKYVVK